MVSFEIIIQKKLAIVCYLESLSCKGKHYLSYGTKCNLVDAWRIKHSRGKQYTWARMKDEAEGGAIDLLWPILRDAISAIETPWENDQRLQDCGVVGHKRFLVPIDTRNLKPLQ
ncbi:unnamed protein product [Menidia menidia]|uniref:(Atlantic silverside) hypothetical protein n=1 Tax=Menidia menidia TaxID=238744 RepID=A0A8S4BPY6_9TELE|nr:unnamed protein product [Menidia menidia]